MKRSLLPALLSLQAAVSQNRITFTVEELTPPQAPLPMTPSREVYENLMLGDVSMFRSTVARDSIDFPYNILAERPMPDSLVTYGYHSFFNGMYRAYADHRPFVLSPDMI